LIILIAVLLINFLCFHFYFYADAVEGFVQKQVWDWKWNENTNSTEWKVTQFIDLGNITSVAYPYRTIAYVLWYSQIGAIVPLLLVCLTPPETAPKKC
jgi:hypothetical protein